MSNVVSFPGKKAGDDWDDEVMCTLTINGKGDIELIVNAWRIETVEQHNWLIAKIVDAASRVIGRKNEEIDS